MDKEIKVVIGANYGDEGKGLVSYCLSKEAAKHGRKVLNVFYNGGAQRGHTVQGVVQHGVGGGFCVGADTYYNMWFMLDPIAVWLEGVDIYYNRNCRVVLPCDVINNRQRELARGENRHGSCGMGIYACALRNASERYGFEAHELMKSKKDIYDKLIKIEEHCGYPRDLVYNNDNFMRACTWVKEHCNMVNDDETLFKNYDTIIFEGGQGLLLDQIRYGPDNVHLTPSSPGVRNCVANIIEIGEIPQLYYVSRSYITRHGAGEVMDACKREDINSDIVDLTNQPNPWQGKLRYGYLDDTELARRIFADSVQFPPIGAKINLVYTHLNYTNGKIAAPGGVMKEIEKPDFVEHIYGSDRKDDMDILI